MSALPKWEVEEIEIEAKLGMSYLNRLLVHCLTEIHFDALRRVASSTVNSRSSCFSGHVSVQVDLSVPSARKVTRTQISSSSGTGVGSFCDTERTLAVAGSAWMQPPNLKPAQSLGLS